MRLKKRYNENTIDYLSDLSVEVLVNVVICLIMEGIKRLSIYAKMAQAILLTSSFFNVI